MKKLGFSQFWPSATATIALFGLFLPHAFALVSNPGDDPLKEWAKAESLKILTENSKSPTQPSIVPPSSGEGPDSSNHGNVRDAKNLTRAGQALPQHMETSQFVETGATLPSDAILIAPPDDHLPEAKALRSIDDPDAINHVIQAYIAEAKGLVNRDQSLPDDAEDLINPRSKAETNHFPIEEREVKSPSQSGERTTKAIRIVSPESQAAYYIVAPGDFNPQSRAWKKVIAKQHMFAGKLNDQPMLKARGRNVVILEVNEDGTLVSKTLYHKPTSWQARTRAWLKAVVHRPTGKNVAAATVCTLAQITTTVCFTVANAYFSDAALFDKIMGATSWWSAFTAVMDKGAMYPNALLAIRAAFPFLIGVNVETYQIISDGNGKRFKMWFSNMVGGLKMFLSLVAINGFALDAGTLGIALWAFSFNILINSLYTSWGEPQRYATKHHLDDGKFRLFKKNKEVIEKVSRGAENVRNQYFSDFFKSFGVLLKLKWLEQAIEAKYGEAGRVLFSGLSKFVASIPGMILGEHYAFKRFKRIGIPEEVERYELRAKRWRSLHGIKEIAKESMENIFGEKTLKKGAELTLKSQAACAQALGIPTSSRKSRRL